MRFGESLERFMEFSFFSTVAITIALINFSAIQDFLLVPLYEIANNLVLSGFTSSWILASIEGLNAIYLLTPTVLDWLWLSSAIILTFELIMASYYMKREGYMALMSFLFWGTMLLLFVMNVYIILSNWVLSEILNPILPNLVYSTPFFNYYLTYAGIINTIIIVACVIANAVDFDFSTYFQRKNKEEQLVNSTSSNDEVA